MKGLGLASCNLQARESRSRLALVSCPDRRSSPRVKRSGARSRIHSWNVVKTNEIAGFVIITFWNAITEQQNGDV